MSKPYHITRLEIDSFKRIVATAICPADGKPILLTGDNGMGKSSILDSILWAFTNSGIGMPIMEGQPSAIVGVRIANGADEYVIKRRAKGSNRYLEVTGSDGQPVPKPQGFLDSLIGNLAFDPEAFVRLKDKEQANQLREAAGLDTELLDEKAKEVYTLRAAANKEALAAEGAYKAAPVAAGAVREPVSAGGLAEERDRLREEVGKHDSAKRLADDCREEIRNVVLRIEELKKEVARQALHREQLEFGLKRHEAALASLAADLSGHPERIEEITQKLGNIDAENADIQRCNDAIRLRASRHEAWKQAHAKAEKLDALLKELREERARVIAEAVMPVEGLAIEDDVVTLHGIPLGDLNTAKRIEVATRIAIAQNPGLGVIFVREGALINETNLGIIAGIAEEAGVQVWIEKFQTDAGEKGLHIVEGMVVKEDGTPAAPVQCELI